MGSTKELLNQIINNRPNVIQFAKDRKYEESWIIPINNNPPSEKGINNFLNKENFKILIVEYIWNSDNDDKRFVFTLFLDNKCVLQDPTKFMNICLNIFYN